MRIAVVLVCVAACGDDAVAPDAPAPTPPTANPAREIVDTRLAIDVTALTGTATITFAPSASPGATLEVGTLEIERVTLDGADLAVARADLLDLALPASDAPLAVEIAYRWRHHERFTGASATGYTLMWPYHCGNVFPCHSAPADGTTFALELAGVPAGKTAVYPATLTAEAPAYQLAWSYDDYVETPLGATTAGTEVVVWHLASEAAAAATGTAHLVAAFDWLERTLGPYRFGSKVGSVSARWGLGAFGGMEHHPFWHVGSAAMADVETHIHEAVHGWFGGGIRIACWEDFVLSEGTTTYLAGRALDVVAPDVGAATWASYETQLGRLAGTSPVWPQSCGQVDVIEDGLFTRAPYIRGAFFFRALAERLGAEVVDGVLAAFYAEHATKAATMADLLAKLQAMTGYDPAACAATWLTSTTRPAPGPCP